MKTWSTGPWLIAACLACASIARAAEPLDAGDEAPAFMLYTYNEDVAIKASGTNTPALGNFLGASPEVPKDAVLLVFVENTPTMSAQMELLAKLQRKYSGVGQGLQILAIGIEAEAVEMNDLVAHSKGLNFPVLRDRFLVATERYGVERGGTPVAYLLLGERPRAALTPQEEGAFREAFETRDFEWTIRITSRWTGDLVSQEDAIARSIEAALGR